MWNRYTPKTKQKIHFFLSSERSFQIDVSPFCFKSHPVICNEHWNRTLLLARTINGIRNKRGCAVGILESTAKTVYAQFIFHINNNDNTIIRHIISLLNTYTRSYDRFLNTPIFINNTFRIHTPTTM